MLKKTITYTDYNGEEITEDFYFNLSKAEIMEMEMTMSGGYVEMVRKIVQTKDIPTITKAFKDIILKAYGEKTADGKRFRKIAADGHRLCDDFTETEAYSVLFMELMTDADKAADFVNGILPADLLEEAEKNKDQLPQDLVKIIESKVQ